MINVREIVNNLEAGVGKMAEMDPAFMGSFSAFDGAAAKSCEAITEKQKELICVSLAVSRLCEYCICAHVRGAYKAGATRAEILAAAQIAITFGGGPTFAYTSAVLTAALDEFEHDFDK